MAQIKGLLFDLDGVLVDTAKLHFLAWQKLATQLGITFTVQQNEELKGVSRRNSLLKILNWGGLNLPEADIEHYMALKNEWYLALVKTLSPKDVLAGAEEFIKESKAAGLKIALGSASKNAVPILDRLQLTTLFDAVIDGNTVTSSKPDPTVFLKGAQALNLQPQQCLVFEDAKVGIQAAHAAGMKAIGIGHPKALQDAQQVWPNFAGRDVHTLLKPNQ